MTTQTNPELLTPAPVALQPVVMARWDIDPATNEAREWRIIAKEDIEGGEWTFPKGKRLRGFKDLHDGDWCVYAPGQYMESRIFGVPENLLEIVRPAKRHNDPSSATPPRGPVSAPDVLERSEDVARGSSGARG